MRAVLLTFAASAAICNGAPFTDANWVSMGGLPGTSGGVDAAVVDGLGNLYVGGGFGVAGRVIARGIAKWDGTSWSALGSGIDWGYVKAVAIAGSDIYMGGSFALVTNADGAAVGANNIARWNGSSWSALGTGIEGTYPVYVSAIAVNGSVVYVGGQFTTAGGQPAANIARWDGTNWTAVGSGVNSNVTSLALIGGDLYAGGYFTTAGGITANRIAKWDATSWSALGSGMTAGEYPFVYSLAVSGSTLYAGGGFTVAGGTAANYIAKWNGTSWSALGTGMRTGGFGYSAVNALLVSGSELYAGGYFPGAGGLNVRNIAKWDGSNWSGLGEGIEHVLAMAKQGTNLYIGGSFQGREDHGRKNVAKWDGSGWSALGLGINEDVRCVAVAGQDVYIGGWFVSAGDVEAHHIAKWNGTNWSALGSGMDSTVSTIAASGTKVYAGGSFTMAGGQSLNGLAEWDGTNWSGLGTGVSGGGVSVLAVSGTDLYVGGGFDTAGGVWANKIAKWDGSSWSALGFGIDGFVGALAIQGTNIYAGGFFTTADGIDANSIAKWDGSSWSPLGSGMGGGLGNHTDVRGIGVSGSNVYVGGNFTTAGGIPANYVARWDGSTWSPLGEGATYIVDALVVSGGYVYVAGPTSGGGGRSISRWDGSTWTPLGSAMGGVYSLAISGNQLYAGGYFLVAGGKVSAYVARACLDLPSLSTFRYVNNMSISWPTGFERFVLQQNSNLASNDWSTASYPLITNGTIKSAIVPLTGGKRFFRLVEQ